MPLTGTFCNVWHTVRGLFLNLVSRFGNPLDLNGARRKNATRETTAALKAWLYEHRKNPYPTKGEKIMLAIITKMTLTQVRTRRLLTVFHFSVLWQCAKVELGRLQVLFFPFGAIARFVSGLGVLSTRIRTRLVEHN